MNESSSVIGPVIIGGVGGSGTRVVAEIAALFGFYLGNDLNSASDNLSYTLLFKRPEWFRHNIGNKRQIYTGLSILEKSIIKGGNLTIRERIFLWKAVRNMMNYGHNKEGEGKGDWPVQRLPYIKAPQIPEAGKLKGWGWKEPNSHLLVPVFNEYFPHFKYIHTIRHGLDMAYSSNQQQLYNWASLFGIDIPENPEEIPSASFRYWVEANRRVISTGNQIGSEKFLTVNFDELCQDPLPGVRKIADFLGVSQKDELMLEAARLPVMPKSAGRYKEHPGKIFDPKDLSFLQGMGFKYQDLPITL